MATQAQTRGIRNNNPLNIEKGEPWQGLRPEQTDPRFAQFVSLEYGFRAAFVIIHNYLGKRPPVNTPAAIISRWAPPDENLTDAYIRFVCKRAELKPHEIIRWQDKNKLSRLVWAMAEYECGTQFHFGRVENAYELAKR